MIFINRIFGFYYRKIFSPLYSSCLRLSGVHVGRAVVFFKKPIIIIEPGSFLSIGDNCVICSDVRFTALGLNHPVVIKTVSKKAKIIIKNNCGISGGTIVSYFSIEIGEGSMLGANTTIIDTDFHPTNPEGRRRASIDKAAFGPVVLGKNVFVGAGAYVMKNVIVGDGSIIGAGSILRKNIDACKLFVSDGKKIKDILE